MRVPGFIDLHAHLREPGFTHKETIASGTEKARLGGFQLVCAMPNLHPAPDCPEALEIELKAIRETAQTRVLPFGTITKGRAGKELSDIAGMRQFVAGYSDDGSGVQDGALMEAAMREIAKTGKLLSAHCEDASLIPPGGCVHAGAAAARFGVPGIPSKSETLQLERDLALAARTGVRYHMCHISAKESVAAIRRAKRAGLNVSCEVTPHQIFFTDECVAEDSGRFKMNPPLRAEADRRALIEGLIDGTIDAIATDHAPHTAAEKSLGLLGSAFGVEGFQTAFAACYTALVKPGAMPLEALIDKLVYAPARLLGISPGESNLRLDTRREWVVSVPNSPFYGLTLTGGCEWITEG